MPLQLPTFMPAARPNRTSDTDVLEYRAVPGISFHREGDGIVYYYDQPLVFVAWYGGEMVVATLTDEDYEGPPEQAKGWKQTMLVSVTPEFLHRVYTSELPFRSLYEQPDAKTWFIHEDWQLVGEKTWAQQIQVFDGVPFPEASKPDPGEYLDPSVGAASDQGAVNR